MTTYAAVVGNRMAFTGSTPTALPAGSAGDRLVMLCYFRPGTTMSTPSGWSRFTVQLTAGGRIYIFQKVRGSESTVTLPLVFSGDGGYAILNIVGIGPLVDHEIEGWLLEPTWQVNRQWYRQVPRFTPVLVASEDSTDDFAIIGGNFVEVASAANPGDQNILRLLVADPSSNPVHLDIEGGWDAGGWAAWGAAFFSDEEPPPPAFGGWQVGSIGFA